MNGKYRYFPSLAPPCMLGQKMPIKSKIIQFQGQAMKVKGRMRIKEYNIRSYGTKESTVVEAKNLCERLN